MSVFKWLIVIVVLLFSSCGNKKTTGTVTSKGPEATQEEAIQYPKNIILMIGDGMGLAHITAAMYLNRKGLYLEKFPVVGFQKTFSGDNLVTDSAAGATAIACGVKTYNNGIGVDMDTLPVPSILELAEKKNMATGIVVTSQLTHGTPAPFFAHVAHREFNEKIAAQFLDSDIDFFVGGGKKFFENRESDDRNISEELKDKGYQVSDFFNQDIFEMHISSRRNFVYFTAENKPVSALSGRRYLPYVSSMGIKHLRKRSDEGFFMLIEGSQIDWGGHSNEAEYIVAEMNDFNTTIGRVLKYAKKDKNTLVIVTADHECGGVSINNGSTKDELVTAFTSNTHTADMIPVFAYRPKSALFHGVYDNTEIHKKMKQALQLDTSPGTAIKKEN